MRAPVRSPWVGRGIALGFGAALVVLSEGFLALFGVSPLAARDPFQGFGGGVPLFVPEKAEGGTTRYVLNPVKERYFNRQSFVMPKPAGVHRTIALGGSTTYGNPYMAGTAFPSWLTRLLARFEGTRTYEAINAGGISYASYRVRRLGEELTRFSPDLYVVYAGHNEFLEARTYGEIREQPRPVRLALGLLHRSRIYTLLADGFRRVRRTSGTGGVPRGEEVQATLEEVGGPELYHRDAALRATVLARYEESLRDLAGLVRRRNIPLVLCTLPSNLSGVSPFKSEHRSGMSEADLLAWEGAFREAADRGAQGRFEESLALLEKAERLDGEYALLHYRKGEVLRRLGRLAEARAAYERARDEDIVPLRALGEMNEVVRRVAATEGAVLADVEEFFLRVAEGGIPGDDLFMDHVHPTIEGQQMVAWVVMNAATAAGVLPLSGESWRGAMPAARRYLAEEDERIPARYRAMGYWGVGRLYYWAGKYLEAEPALLSAWATVRDVPEVPLRLAQIRLLKGDPEGALPLLAAALELDPGSDEARLALANAEVMAGRAEAALATLARVRSARPAAVHHVRALALVRLGRTSEALSEFARAVEIAPEVPSLRLALAGALREAGRRREAEEEFRAYLRLDRAPDAERQLARWRAGAWAPGPPQ